MVDGGRIRVAIADDERLFCDGVRMMVDAQPDMRLVAAVHDGAAAVELVAREQLDVILLDLRMPRLDGIAATGEIRALAGPAGAPAVVVLTTLRHEWAAAAAAAAGATAYLLKDATAEVLTDTIREVRLGHRPVATPSISRSARVDVLSPLTAREREVFLYAARGQTNAEIAVTAFISEATVKSHLSHVLQKLGLRSRMQLTALALEEGLIR